MSNVIYILSDKSSPNKGFKVGSYTGSLKDFISHYSTSIPQLKVHYFIEIDNASTIVSDLTEFCGEWVQDDSLEEIFENLMNLIFSYQNRFKYDNNTRIINVNYPKICDNDEKEYEEIYDIMIKGNY